MRSSFWFWMLSGFLVFAEDPEVLYAPEAVYVGKPMTFRVQPHGQAGSLTTNGVEWVKWNEGDQDVIEASVFPREAMQVQVLKEEKVVWTFGVIQPGKEGAFTERDGFLEVEERPAILLAEAKLPPKLDRRWETLNLVRKKLFERKPELPQPLWILPEGSTLPTTLPASLPFSMDSKLEMPSEAWFRTHGVLMSIKAEPAAFVAVELDLHDLKRGVPPQVWIAKWQFILQHLKAQTGYTSGILFAPDVPGDSEWHALLEEELESLARANGLLYVDRSRKDVWKERLVDKLSKTYRLPKK